MYGNIYQLGNPYAGSQWRKKFGALRDIGPHTLAGLWPLMAPVSTVCARPGPAGTDAVHLVLGHGPAGGTSLVSMSLTIPPAAEANDLSLYGDSGVLRRPPLAWDTLAAYQNAVSELALSTQGLGTPRNWRAEFGP